MSQCPCSGTDAGSSFGLNEAALWVLLTLAFGVWLAVKWTKSTWNKQGASVMGKVGKLGIVVALIAAFCYVAVSQLVQAPAVADQESPVQQAPKADALPRLVDLGSKQCIPCKKMEPILEELKTEYAGRLDVEFIDVGLRENAAKARAYGVKLIPTQVFLDKDGKELWRHEGFMGKAEILAKWKELGYDFQTKAAPATAPATSPAS
jgi:thioredoxin 1